MSDDLGHPKLGKHGGPRTKGQRSAEVMPSGGRRDYILARLERDGRHDLAEAIREGRVSALTIAVEMGWTKRPETLGLGSGNAAKRRQHQLRALTGGGLSAGEAMELWLGPSHNGSLFDSPEALRAAWETHRDEFMAGWGRQGRRPQIWWEFDAPALGLKWPGYFNEQSYLHDAGALAAEEKAELERGWKVEFERALAPDFTLNDGSGEILTGDCARAAYHRWADIPDKLVRRWSAARRRRARGKRQPVAPSAGSEEAAAIK